MSNLPTTLGALSLTGGIQLIALAARHWTPRRRRTTAPSVGLAILKPRTPRYATFHNGPLRITPIGTVHMGFRYCPEEQRVRAAILHPDGSATCDENECRAFIPAAEPHPHMEVA